MDASNFKQFYLLINWFWLCFFHSDYVKAIYIIGLLIWIMHSPKSIESTMYTSAVHTYNNRQIKNGIYLSLIIAVKWENTCTLLYQHFIENFLYTALIFCMEGGSAEIFDMLFLFWPISTSGFDLSDFSFTGKTRAEGFSNRWTWNRNYHIYIDLKIRLLQKRENERLNGCFKYTKNGINSVQYIPVHIKAQKHIYLCMHAFMLDPQSRPYFLF